MDAEPPGLEQLRAALGEIAAGDALQVLEEARAEARARVRTLLADALSQAMMSAIRDELSPGPPPPPARAKTPAPQASVAGGDTALYVYGIVGAETEGLRELPPGVGDQGSVRPVRVGDLSALVSDVAAADFDEERLREHLGDIKWVESTARGHEAVLEAIAARATVVPMRMCSVYASETGVRELLHREAKPLRAALDYLQGKSEWGVKVLHTAAPSSAGDSAREPAGQHGASGAEYMQRRLAERDAEAEAIRHVEDAAGVIHERLREIAADAVLASPQRPELSGRPGQMMLNGVYLVEDGARQRFRDEIGALAGEFGSLGLELELTGPWPAYNFVPGAIGAGW